jgi:hypothetical protein
MLVRERHRRALHTVFLFLGGTLGAAIACERLDDLIETRHGVYED